MRRLAIALLLSLLATNGARASDAVYFWRIQRGDSGERALADLVREKEPDTLRPLVLVAEIGLKPLQSTIHEARRTDIAGSPALRVAKRPVTVVLRIGRHSTGFDTDVAWQSLISAELRHALDAFQKAGVPVDEAQLDFDCPASRLDAYADLVSEIRKQFPNLRFSVTGMPAWLDKPGLPKLLQAVNSWTLQVHLTDLPKTTASLPPLCDTTKARRWIARAAEYGKNFRVALPTYSYRAHFDASGKFAFVKAEAGLATMQNGSIKHWSPDFTAVAALVKELHAAPPAHCDGIAWFRLPCDDDRHNLVTKAFAKLRRGEAPEPGRIVPRVVPDSEDRHVVDLFLENLGDIDAEPPTRLVAHAPRPQFNDLPGATRMDYQNPDTLTIFPAPTRLRPGERRRLGWMRFRDPITPEFTPSFETVSIDSNRRLPTR